MTLIALVRHGETEWNRLGRVQGHSDIPLNDTGRAQAAGAGEALRGGDYRRLFASPLDRAKETAEIIGRATGLGEPVLHAGLKERMYGEAEGMTALDYWSTYPDRNAPGSETSNELQARALATLEEIADTAGPDPVIAVAHGGLISTILRYASDGALPREGEHVGNGSQQIVEVTGSDVRVIGYTGSPR